MLSGIILAALGGTVLYQAVRLFRDWRVRISASEPPITVLERVPIFATIGVVGLLALGMIVWGVMKIFP